MPGISLSLGLAGGRRTPAPPEPSDIAGLAWRIDGTLLSALYQERTGGGTTAAAADLDVVGTARDQSTSALNAAAPSDAARPSLEVAGGKGRLCFDGVNDVLTGSQVTLPGAWTLAMSYRLRATPGANTGVALVNVLTGTGEKIEIVAINYAGFRQLTWSARMTTVGATSIGVDKGLDLAPHRLVITYSGGTKSSAASYRCWFDGVEVVVGTGTAIGAIGGDTTAIGARWNGSAASANAALDLDQVLLYDGVKSDADVGKLNTILANKRRRSRLLLVLGDSIAAGWVGDVGAVVKVSSWPWKVKKLYPDATEPDVINLAIPGQTTAQVLARIAECSDILATASSVDVLVGSGVNDIGTTAYLVNSGDVPTAINNLNGVCDAVRVVRPDARILVQTLLPRSDGNMDAGYPARRPTYNTSLAGGVAARSLLFNDLRAIEGTIALGDLIHPTDAGYATMATSAKATLDA